MSAGRGEQPIPDRAEQSGERPVQMLLLAGSVRISRVAVLANQIGLPLGVFPIDGTNSILSWWFGAIAASSPRASVSVAISDPSERQFFERIAQESVQAGGFSVWIDRNQHRGAGGTVRDFVEDRGFGTPADGLLIAECSTFGDFDLRGFLASIVPEAEATVLAGADGAPCGVMHVSERALRRIPAIGYFDLKEQLLPAIASAGGMVPVVRSEAASFRISDRRSYLALLGARHARGLKMVSEQASVDASASIEGMTLLARGSVVRERAIVSGSVVMQGADIGAGAIVARSVVPPGARVPAGARIIDEVYASLSSDGRGES
jgi:hypothetical protein